MHGAVGMHHARVQEFVLGIIRAQSCVTPPYIKFLLHTIVLVNCMSCILPRQVRYTFWQT